MADPQKGIVPGTYSHHWRNDVPRGLRCLILSHPWRWSANEFYIRRGVSFKVCTKRGCNYGR